MGLVLTNLNDYAIFDKNWKRGVRQRRAISEVNIGLEKANISSYGEYGSFNPVTPDFDLNWTLCLAPGHV